MALTITGFPSPIAPAYNIIQFTFESTNYTEEGFRYVIDVYSGDNITRLTRQKVIPQVDGSGKIDLSRILQNYVSVDFAQFATTTDPATNSFFDYNVRIGEEYKPSPIPFGITSSLSAGTTILLSPSADTNTYVVGDQIFVTSDLASINGFKTVLSATTTLVIVDGTWDGNNHTGTTQYADGRKVLFSDLESSTGNTVFNGVRSFAEFLNYSSNSVNVGTPNTIRMMLTDLPLDNFYLRPTQLIWLDVMITKTNPYNYNLISISNDGQTGNTGSVGANDLREVVQFPFSFFDTGFDLTNVTYVDLFITRDTGGVHNQLTKKYRVYLDNRCVIEPIEIAFQDRMGSIGSFSFQLRKKETGDIERVQFKQEVPYPYTTIDRGTTNIWIGVEKELELNTNWMTEEMNIYFEQLLTSPYTWINFGDGLYYACTIVDSTFEVEFQKNKRLIRKTIVVKMANNDSINV